MTLKRLPLSVTLLALSGALAFAGNPEKTDVNGVKKTNTADHYTSFLINNIFNYYSNNGDGSYNKYTSNGGFEFTKGSGRTTVFEDGIVWGGFHKGRPTPKVGGSVYRHAVQPGRIITPGGPTETESAVPDDPMKPEYRVFRVRADISPSRAFTDVQAVLNDEAALINRYESVTAQTLFDAYVRDWNEWPAKTAGNPAGLAPFTDLNGDGTYEPGVDIPGEPGASQTLYYVANDLNPTLTQYLAGCPPIGLEMHRTFWGYPNEGAFGNTILSRTTIINKSGAPVDSMFLVQWADPDVGDPGDDFVGCDVPRNLGFAYNGWPTDWVYGMAVPSVGYDLLQGAIVSSPGDSAMFQMNYRHGYKNLNMTTFSFFTAAFVSYFDPAQGLNGDIQWYNLMNGYTARDGAPFINPLTGQPTKFTMDGDPGTGQGWVDGMAGPHAAGPPHVPGHRTVHHGQRRHAGARGSHHDWSGSRSHFQHSSPQVLRRSGEGRLRKALPGNPAIMLGDNGIFFGRQRVGHNSHRCRPAAGAISPGKSQGLLRDNHG